MPRLPNACAAAGALNPPLALRGRVANLAAAPRAHPQVKATCIIEGQYALTAVQNWPAQMQLCGPNGGQPCSGNSYDPGAPTLTPSKVTYNSTNNRYTAEYTFTIDDAWKGQPITHRYFLCLYEDASANVVQKSGASIDVVRLPGAVYSRTASAMSACTVGNQACQAAGMGGLVCVCDLTGTRKQKASSNTETGGAEHGRPTPPCCISYLDAVRAAAAATSVPTAVPPSTTLAASAATPTTTSLSPTSRAASSISCPAAVPSPSLSSTAAITPTPSTAQPPACERGTATDSCCRSCLGWPRAAQQRTCCHAPKGSAILGTGGAH